MEVNGWIFTIDSFPLATEIFTSFEQPIKIVNFDVDFGYGIIDPSYPTDEQVKQLLIHISTTCADSITSLNLSHLNDNFIEMFQRIHGKTFHNLERLFISNSVLTRRLLEAFSHAQYKTINNPTEMLFDSNNVVNIPFNNLNKFVLRVYKHVGTQTLPIVSSTVEYIGIFDTFSVLSGLGINVISIASLEQLTNLRFLLIEEGKQLYSVQDLNQLQSKNTLELLAVALEKDETVENVNNFVCALEKLNDSTFIFDHLHKCERKQIDEHKTINCGGNNGDAHYDVSYMDSGSHVKYYVKRK